MRVTTILAGLGLLLATQAAPAQQPAGPPRPTPEEKAQDAAKKPKKGKAQASRAGAQLGPSPAVPPPLTPEDTWNLDLSTGGRVVIQLRPDKAPLMAERIRVLTRRGFYNGLTFHRVIDGFMAQGGDPKGDGTGGSDLPDVKAEFNALPHVRGAVAAARSAEENSANSQFYIMLSPNLRLDNHYTVFGRVISGMQYVDAIEKGEPPANPSRIVTATIGAEAPAAVSAPPPPPPLPVPAPPPAPAPAPAPVPTRQ
ncbi:peptidylprolyl isomerase [Sphingomonas quercus]|uniref:peptidylprolyl isomerase n=1 Tax=Sphingomonas quercus TaxID=2842451 RepID=A0ABS6BG50_9SPHN|nr:peptidylprolyl isomerase [Sphingomonas quercus]